MKFEDVPLVGPFGAGSGGEERGKAQNAANLNKKHWLELQQWYNEQPQANLGVDFNENNTDTNTLHSFHTGPMEAGVREDFLDPNEASAAGLQGMSAADPRFSDGGSAWVNDRSAFDSRDPSAFDSRDPSAFGDLGYDEQALAGIDQGADYFANLSSGGTDPIADAQYAHKVAEAEASRRSNTDAALAAEEARGAGSGSGRLLAELSNQQASVGDQYLAGTDANAMAAGRRDFAARQGADISDMRGQGLLTADTARAGGLDNYSGASAQGRDTYSAQNAQGQDVFATAQNQGQDTYAQRQQGLMDDWASDQYANYYGTSERNADREQGSRDRNFDRTWGTMDENTGLLNQAASYNLVDRPQQDFSNRMDLQGGLSDAYMGQAGIYSGTAGQKQAGYQHSIDPLGKGASNVFGFGGKKASGGASGGGGGS